MEKNVDYREISENIRRYFAGNGISIHDAAEKLGMNQPSLSTALSGRKITKRFAIFLASVYPFNVDYLVTGKGSLLDSEITDGYYLPVSLKKTGGYSGDLVNSLVQVLSDSLRITLHVLEENKDLRCRIEKLEENNKKG